MSYIEKTEQLNFQVILRRDGNIEIKFLAGDQERFSGICDPQQVGTIATGLLSAASSSVQLVGTSAQPQIGNVALDAAIPVTNWYFGDTKSIGQKAVVVEIGKAKIGFIVTHDQMRGLGRTIVSASWKTGTSSSSAQLRLLLREFVADLRSWCSIARARVATYVQRRVNLISTWVAGRSFRPFRTIPVGPGLSAPEYPPFRKCIYCDDTIYSHDPLNRKYPLGAEHIIAEGLGGTLEIPEASCQKCEEATGAVVESDVLGRTMKAIRVHLRLRKSSSGPPPKTLPLTLTSVGKQKAMEIPIEDYPILFVMYAYGPPNIDGSEGMPTLYSAVLVRIKHDPRLLFQKYGITAFATAYLDNVMMCRMLAKIGHALAVAEIGIETFKPLLPNLIRKGDDQREMRFIGGASTSMTVPPNTLHHLSLGYQKIKTKTYVVAHIQLFASYGAPTYAVVVGESLESPMARFKRILSSKRSPD
jgi:hypothetical protein